MHILLPALVSILALGASAAPSAGPNNWLGFGQQCLDDKSADRVANNFKSLIDNYSNASATAFLTVDYTDYSDSVSELINNACTTGPANLGQPTFASRAAFEAGQGGQPNIPFEILNVWHNCDTVTMRWQSIAPGGSNAQQVTGIAVHEVVRVWSGKEPWVIKTTFSEFNSGAWLVDLGLVTPTTSCSDGAARRL